MYHAGEAAGNMCTDICDSEVMKYQKCTNYRQGKKTLIYEWNGMLVILKSKKKNIENYDPVGFKGMLKNEKVLFVNSDMTT